MIPFFIAWNLVLYAVATIASYRHHEPFSREVSSSQRDLRRAKNRWERSAAVLDEARVTREKRFLEKQEHALWLQEEVKRLGSVYWAVNLLVRKDWGEPHDSDFPKSYYLDLTVTIPDDLKSLNWDRTSPARSGTRPGAPETVARIQVPLQLRSGSVNERNQSSGQDEAREITR